jgi:iron complex outermembrane recepter protein
MEFITRAMRRGFVAAAGTVAIFAINAATQAAAENAQGTADTPAPDASALQEVVVTAQYRAESIQVVPISITAFTEEALEDRGSTQFQDYAVAVPGLSFADRGPNRDQIVIRGISPITGVSAVGVYLDQIASSNPFDNPDIGLFDIDRIEILRGPQGTLYGEGSLGGTIRIFTNKPSFDGYQGKIELIGSSTENGGGNGDFNAAVNLPLSDKIALRISGYDHSDSGWINNVFDGENNINWHHSQGARAALRIAPTEDLDIQLIVNTQYDRVGLLNEQDPTVGRYLVNRLTDQGEDERNTQYTLIADYKVLSGSFEEVFGLYQEHDFRGVDSASTIGVPGLDLYYHQQNKVVSNETRYVSSFGGPFNFVAGVYFKDLERPVSLDLVDGGELFGLPGDYLNVAAFDDRTYAAYGEAYYNITSQFKATVGLRWAHDQVGGPSSTSIGSVVLDNTDLSGSYQATTPKFGLSYQATPTLLVFADAAEGYRAGGINPIPPIPPSGAYQQTFKPDKDWSYELGVKSEQFDRRLIANASVYYIKWNDLQILGLPDNPALGFTTNAGDAHSEGFEVELAAKPLRGLEIDLNTGYTHAVLDQPAQGAPAGTLLPNVPRWGVSAAAQYEWHLVQSWSAFSHLDWAYKTSTNEDVPADAIGYIPSYSIANARLGAHNDRYGVYLFCTNLTNSLGITGAGESGQYTMRPRTYGIDLRATF